jgi:hypothetical protein
LGVGFNVGDRARPLLTEQEIRELNAKTVNTPEFKPIVDAASGIRDFKNGLKEVSELGARGIFDTEKISKTVDSYERLEKIFKGLKEQGDLAKPELLDGLEATLNANKSRVEDLEKISKEIDSINVKLIDGVEAARRKTRELAQEQVLIMNVIRGTMNEGILDAFDTVGFVDEQLALVEKTRQQVIQKLDEDAKRRSGNPNATADPEGVAQANAAAEEFKEAIRIESINKILLRRKEIEEQINDLQDKRNGRSELTTLDKISQDLIKSQLSVDDESKKAFKDLTEQLQILNTTISVMNANISGAGGTLEMATRTVPFGGGSSVALGAAIDFSAMSFMMRDAVAAGVKEAMQGQQKPVVEVMEKVNNGVNRISIGAQN